jgi:KaiC/GvpD/RAD55 family RecA-like ATPase
MQSESPRPFVVSPHTAPPRSPTLADSTPRVPTGVPDFDYLSGGVPSGSVILLLGEAGSGHQEFALTSAVQLMLHHDDPAAHRLYLGNAPGPFVYPKSVALVSTSRSREQVLAELRSSFPGIYPEVMERHMLFHDLSPVYFRDSVVPTSWAELPGPLLSPPTGPVGASSGAVSALAEALEASGTGRLVVVDSLTDLLVRDGVEPKDVLTLLKGLRRRAKEWNGLVYLLLSEGVASPAVEQAVIDSVDGVLQFRWTASPNHSHRQRTMLIKKFMSVLARVPTEYHGSFVIRVNPSNGLVTTQYERV